MKNDYFNLFDLENVQGTLSEEFILKQSINFTGLLSTGALLMSEYSEKSLVFTQQNLSRTDQPQLLGFEFFGNVQFQKITIRYLPTEGSFKWIFSETAQCLIKFLTMTMKKILVVKLTTNHGARIWSACVYCPTNILLTVEHLIRAGLVGLNWSYAQRKRCKVDLKQLYPINRVKYDMLTMTGQGQICHSVVRIAK